MEVTHYGVLGLHQGASEKEIKQAFRRIALLHHPDRGENADIEKFKRALAAHDVLMDVEKRQAYDIELQSRLTFTPWQRNTAAAAFSEKHRTPTAAPGAGEDNSDHHSPDNDPPRQESPKRRPYRSRFEKEAQHRHEQKTSAVSRESTDDPSADEAKDSPEKKSRGRRLSSNSEDNRGRKRSRFDFSEFSHTPPLTATYGKFDLHNVFSAMPERPPPRQTYRRMPKASSRVPQNSSQGPETPDTRMLSPRFFLGPPIPHRPPNIPGEMSLGSLEEFWREYLEYSQTVASALLQGSLQIGSTPLQDIVSQAGVQGMHQIIEQTRNAMDGWLWATNECKGLFMDIGFRGGLRDTT